MLSLLQVTPAVEVLAVYVSQMTAQVAGLAGLPFLEWLAPPLMAGADCQIDQRVAAPEAA